MIYDCQLRSFDVDLKSPEIVREDSRIKYATESLLLFSEADICKELPADAVESTLRNQRISYGRERLLSLATINVCKELPYGFDQSIISDLQDAYKSPPAIQEPQHHESVSAGGLWAASNREYPERWDSFKLTTADRAYKSAPEVRKLQAHESLLVGGLFGYSTEESAQRWDHFKLISADSKSTDSETFNWDQLRRRWVNPTSKGILNNALQNPEQSGILGNPFGTKPFPVGSEELTLELPRSSSLLSRCSQPYRPPSYYKAMSQKHEFHSDKMPERAEGHSKQRATEERWGKASFDLKTNEPLQAIEEKQQSSGHDVEVIPKSGARTSLEEHSAYQVVNRFRVDPPISSPVSTSVESPSSNCGTAENRLNSDSMKDQPPLQEEEVTYHVEELQPQILEGGRFSALIILEDAEEVDPDLIDEVNPASNVKPRDDQRIFINTAEKTVSESSQTIPENDNKYSWNNVGFGKAQKKKLRTRIAPLTTSTDKITTSVFPNNTAGETASNSSAANASTSSTVSVKPFSETCNSQGGFEVQHQKDINISSMTLQKGFAAKTSNSDHSVTEAKVSSGVLSEIWLSSLCIKHQDITKDSRDTCKPDSKIGHWILDNGDAFSNFSSWPDLSRNNIWRTSSGTSKNENLLDKRQSREASCYAQELPLGNMSNTTTSKSNSSPLVERNNCSTYAQVTKATQDLGHAFGEVASSQIPEGSKFNSSSHFDDEADTNFEINLPDEDSLITIDDTYIFQADMLNQSPRIPLKGGRTTTQFRCLNKPIKRDSLNQNRIPTDPWFHGSPLNLAKMFANPSNSLGDLRAPPEIQDPWQFYYYNYHLFPADALGQLPLMPSIYEPSLQNFLPSTVPPDQNFYSHHVNNTLPVDPPPYHDVHQMPWCPKKSGRLGSQPGNYQVNNVIPTAMGMRGRHHEEEIRPTFSQILQMQIKMAKKKLKSVPGFEQSIPISTPRR